MAKEKIPQAQSNQIVDAFQQISTQNELSAILKELFKEDKIYLISDLSEDEIKLCTRIHMIAELKNIEIWKSGLAFYMKLVLSKNRKSRKEIIDAFKGQRQENTFSKLNPMNWGRN